VDGVGDPVDVVEEGDDLDGEVDGAVAEAGRDLSDLTEMDALIAYLQSLGAGVPAKDR